MIFNNSVRFGHNPYANTEPRLNLKDIFKGIKEEEVKVLVRGENSRATERKAIFSRHKNDIKIISGLTIIRFPGGSTSAVKHSTISSSGTNTREANVVISNIKLGKKLITFKAILIGGHRNRTLVFKLERPSV